MTKPIRKGLAMSESLYSDPSVKTESKLANSDDIYNIFGRTSLGNYYRDAKNLVILLDTLKGGMQTYQLVFENLQDKYGSDFKKLFLQEVHRG